MVPSTVRTLSIVTMLSAVSGTVFLLQDGGAEAAAAPAFTSSRANSVALGFSGADAAVSLIPLQQPAQTQARHAAMRVQAQADLERQREAAAQKKAEAARRAAAERRREQARERASRDSRRDPKALARLMLAERGWSGQFSCLNSLWTKESGWNYRAMNPSSGAYGIPQSLPGSKMASAGSDWRTNPATQIEWGLNYISDRYGTPCGAWGHSQSTGWY